VKVVDPLAGWQPQRSEFPNHTVWNDWFALGQPIKPQLATAYFSKALSCLPASGFLLELHYELAQQTGVIMLPFILTE
jgi:hypothetical protein